MVDACNVLKTFINQRVVIGKHISIILNLISRKTIQMTSGHQWRLYLQLFITYRSAEVSISVQWVLIGSKSTTVRLEEQTAIFQTTHIGNCLCCHFQHFIKSDAKKRVWFVCYWNTEYYLGQLSIIGLIENIRLLTFSYHFKMLDC